MRTDISIADRVGNGLVAGFIATLVLSALHEPITLVTTAVGVRAPVTGLLFHFFVGTLMWALLMQLVGVLPGTESFRPYLLGTQFQALRFFS